MLKLVYLTVEYQVFCCKACPDSKSIQLVFATVIHQICRRASSCWSQITPISLVNQILYRTLGIQSEGYWV